VTDRPAPASIKEARRRAFGGDSHLWVLAVVHVVPFPNQPPSEIIPDASTYIGRTGIHCQWCGTPFADAITYQSCLGGWAR
jgi:hypothetical protein